jgi:putative LysE/RhtB family amino acid efflux pump
MDVSVFARGFGLGFSIAAVLGPIGVLCLRRSLVSGFGLAFISGLGAATADATYAAVAAFGISAVATLLVDQRFWFRLVGGAFLVYLGQAALRSRVSIDGDVLPESGRRGRAGEDPGEGALVVSRGGAEASGAGPMLSGSAEASAVDRMASGGIEASAAGRMPSGSAEVSAAGRKLSGGFEASAAGRLLMAYGSTLGLTLSNPMTILSFGAIFAGLGIRALEAGSPAASLALVAGVFSGSAAWWFVLASAGARLRRWVTSRRLRWVNIASGLVIVAFGAQSLVAALTAGAA